MTIDNGQPGEWLSLKDAAAALNVSEKTARRRVKAGTLQGRQVDTQHGRAWQVWVDARLPTAGTVDAVGSRPVQGPGLVELVQLVERQQQTIMELSGRVGYLQAELGQAREQLALSAPKEEPAVAATSDVGAVSRPAVTPWWRFWGR